MKKLRVAVFGAGYWAHFQIAAWQAVGAEIVCIWNRTRARAQAAAEKFGIPHVCETPEEVFDLGGFDVADIITDPAVHEPLTLLAAERGVPVICQKPMANSLESCERMVRACKERGVWFAVHENFRFQPQFRLLKQVLESGEAGEIRSAKLQLRSPDRDILAAQPALLQQKNMAYLDMGPHIFDVARYLFGEIGAISSRPVCNYTDLRADMVDEAFSTLYLRDGTQMECNLVHACDYKAEIYGTKGDVLLGWDNMIRVRGGGRERILTPEIPVLSYIPKQDVRLHGAHVFAAIPACLSMLADSLRRGVPAETDGEDNLKTMRTVYAAISSAEQNGAAVKIL